VYRDHCTGALSRLKLARCVTNKDNFSQR